MTRENCSRIWITQTDIIQKELKLRNTETIPKISNSGKRLVTYWNYITFIMWGRNVYKKKVERNEFGKSWVWISFWLSSRERFVMGKYHARWYIFSFKVRFFEEVKGISFHFIFRKVLKVIKFVKFLMNRKLYLQG